MKLYSDFEKSDIRPEKDYYSVSPFLCYQVYYSFKTKSLDSTIVETLLDQLKFEYDETVLYVSSNYSYEIDSNSSTVTISSSIEALTSFDKTELKATLYDYSSSILLHADGEKKNIGETKVSSLGDEPKDYLESIRYYSFQNKGRLNNIDKSLYSISDSYSFYSKTITIWTEDVEKFIFDSIYLPGECGMNNIVLYRSNSPEKSNVYSDLFLSNDTGKYPLTHYRNEGQKFIFNCFNKEYLELKSGFFEKYSDSFLKTRFNEVDCYAWKPGDIYIPFVWQTEVVNCSLALCFFIGNYCYFIGHK